MQAFITEVANWVINRGGKWLKLTGPRHMRWIQEALWLRIELTTDPRMVSPDQGRWWDEIDNWLEKNT